MTDNPEPDFHDAETTGRRISLVWLVPLLALVLAVGVAWKTAADKGPLIEIVLKEAQGVEAGKTLIKRRDVGVGVVEDVGFTEDGSRVLVRARMDKRIARFLDDEAQFWVVSPQVTLEGISGLDTVLSGSYIEAAWDTVAGEEAREFVALESPPLTSPDTPGQRVKLIAEDGGSMSVGAPVFYKRIEVGQVEAKTLTPDGEAVIFELFIAAPHDRRLSQGSRFWNTSGVSVQLGADGAKLQLESFASFLRGGITFDTIAVGGEQVTEDNVFRLFGTEQEARSSIFDDDYGEQMRLSIEFEGSIRGLKVGAPVELRGYKVGEVIDVIASVDERADVPSVSLIVTVILQPSRLGLRRGEIDESLEFLKTLVRNGLRAKLASASLITGSLYIELVDQPEGPEKAIDENAYPYPRLPSVASDLDDLAASAEGVLERINGLPIEELLAAATTLLANVNVIVASDDTKAIPAGINALLSEAQILVSDPALDQATADLAATLAAAREVVESVNRAEIADSLRAALDAAALTAVSITAATADAPALVDNLTRLSGNAADLPLGELVVSATRLLNDADALVAAEETRAIPADLAAAVADVRVLLAGLREADAATALAATLREAGEAATSIREAAATAPELVANLTTLSATARDLPLDDLIVAATALVEDAGAFIGSDGMKRLPTGIDEALDDMRLLLTDLREADAAAALATALTEAGEAAKSLRLAAADAPVLMANLASLSETANGLPLDELIGTANDFVRSAEAFVSSDGIARLPEDVSASLLTIRGLLSELREADAAANLAIALQRAGQAATDIGAAVEGAPELIARLTSVASNVEELPLDSLVVSAEELLREVRAVVGSEAVSRVPESISTTLANIDGLLAELRQAEITARLAGALDAATVTAGSIGTAAQGVPGVLTQIEALAAQVRTLPLDALVGQATLLLADIDRIVTAPGADQLPEAVMSAFDQIRVTVADLQRREVPKNFNDSLVSFNGASIAFQGLSANLNTVLPQVAGLAQRADSVLSEFDVGSELNYEAITTIREIRDAARAISALVATIERQPNSLLLGK